MKKDIFIDNNVTKNFSNPMDAEYKKLVRWLMRYDKNNLPLNAYLVVSNKLIAEYQRTASLARSATCIHVIIANLQREGRLVKYKNARST